MSSAVRHPAVRVRAQRLAVPRPLPTEAQAEEATGFLASRAFWLGGLASVGVWTVVAVGLARLF